MITSWFHLCVHTAERGLGDLSASRTWYNMGVAITGSHHLVSIRSGTSLSRNCRRYKNPILTTKTNGWPQCLLLARPLRRSLL